MRSIYNIGGTRLPVGDDICRGCGTDLKPDDPEQLPHYVYGQALCRDCHILGARTQGANILHDQLLYARRHAFDRGWECMAQGSDGAAWRHSRRGLLVIEGIAFEHDSALQDPEHARHILAGYPTVGKTDYGHVAVLLTLDGEEEIARFRLEDIPDDADLLTLQPESMDLLRAATAFNHEHGWTLWHHVSVSKGGGKTAPIPSYEELAWVRDQFITRERESYQIFPPASRYVNIHPGVLHLWHCLEAGNDAGRVLPAFDGKVLGVVSI
jgi:hypothetical protein